MKVSFDIPERRIADIMVTAMEGNLLTQQWCCKVLLKSKHTGVAPLWYADANLFSEDFIIEVHEIIDESKAAVGRNVRKHIVRPTDLKKGLALMAQKAGNNFGDFMAESEDAVTADVFLQYVSLKELIYG